MKVEKFPNRIKSIIQEFNSLENQKRYKYLIHFNKKILIISRIFFNDNTKEATIKFSAHSKKEFKINKAFIEAITDLQIEKVNVIRKKLKLKSVNRRKLKEFDKEGNPIKRQKGIRKNRELSELEFKALFDERFIDLKLRDEFFSKKNLLGKAEFPKKDFKKVKNEYREIVDEFISKFDNIETINDNYKRNNYGSVSLIVGHSFINNGQIDPRFKTYKSITIIHKQNDPYVKIIVNQVKSGKDIIYYLINKDTMLKLSTSHRWRNRG